MRDLKVPARTAATAAAVVAALLLALVAAIPVEAAGLKPPPVLTYTIAENTSLFVSNATMLAGQPADASVQTTDLTQCDTRHRKTAEWPAPTKSLAEHQARGQTRDLRSTAGGQAEWNGDHDGFH